MGLLTELLKIFGAWSPLVSFLGAYIGGEETVLLLTIIATQGYTPVWVVFLFCFLGIVASDITWFFIGKIRYLSKLKNITYLHKGYKKATHLIDHTAKEDTFRTLLITKFIYGIRIFTIMYLGRKQAKLKEFILADSFVSFIWSIVIVTLGWLAGKGFSIVISVFKNVQLGAILIIATLIIYYLIREIVRKLLTKKQEIMNKAATPIDLKSRSNIEVFLIHAYSGSPDDFHNLPQHLHKKYKINVKVPVLKGHKFTIRDLDQLDYKDFMRKVESQLKKEIKAGKKIILGGYSFGAQLALILAAKYPNLGVFTVCIPYKLRIPFNIKTFKKVFGIKRYWGKGFSTYEKELRKGKSYYKKCHAKCLDAVNDANEEIKKTLHKIDSPILTVYSGGDKLCELTGEEILEKVSSDIKINKIIENKTHTLFYSKNKDKTVRVISNFIGKKILKR